MYYYMKIFFEFASANKIFNIAGNKITQTLYLNINSISRIQRCSINTINLHFIR